MRTLNALSSTDRVIVCVAVVSIALAGAKRVDAGDLEGTWKLVRSEALGTPGDVQDAQLVIEGDRYTSLEVIERHGDLKLDPTKEPKRFERTTVGFGRERVLRGIYRIDDDTLQECSHMRGDDLPVDFSTRPGDSRALFIWKRVAASTKPRPGAELDGTWKLVSRTFRGERQTGGELGHVVLNIESGRYTTRSEEVRKGVLRLDPSTDPKQIDETVTYPTRLKGTVWPGIYDVDGDRLTVSFNGFSMRRPVVFAAKPANLSLRVYERVKP